MNPKPAMPVKQPLARGHQTNAYATQAARIQNKLSAHDPDGPGGAVLSTAEINRTANLLRKAGLKTD